MKIYTLEKGNYEGNDLIMVNESLISIKESMEWELKYTLDKIYFYITVWKDGDIIESYSGDEAMKFVGLD